MKLVVLVALLACGCRQLLGFESANVAEDASTPPPDASACSDLSATCADDKTLRTCTTLGELPVDVACDLGCFTTGGAHCGQISPSGGAVTAGDLDPAVLAMFDEVTLTAGTLDTNTGRFNSLAIGGSDFRVVGTVAVLRFKKLNVVSTINVTGSNALALVADEITIDGVINARGPCTNGVGGPGGFAGGQVDEAAIGPGGGGAGTATNGGGGGGHGAIGGDAGHSGAVTAPGGVSYGDLEITALVGGGGGGGGHQDNNNVGGGGGGAVQLVATTSITIGLTGGINAGGCGAIRQNCASCTHGGGGAGGTLLLESREITISGVLAVNGGGGAGSGSNGENGRLDRVPAAGGSLGNGGAGGDGGTGISLAGQDAPIATQRPGGGGGAVGRIRINALGGTMVTGSMSPAFDDAPTTATQGVLRGE